MSALLEVRDLWVSASKDDGTTQPIVKGVSFEVKPSEVVALIGESGSGKTTIALSALAFTKPGLEFTGGAGAAQAARPARRLPGSERGRHLQPGDQDR